MTIVGHLQNVIINSQQNKSKLQKAHICVAIIDSATLPNIYLVLHKLPLSALKDVLSH